MNRIINYLVSQIYSYKSILCKIPIMKLNIDVLRKRSLSFNLHHILNRILTIEDAYFKYLIFLTLTLKCSNTNRLSLLPTHNSTGYVR